MKKYCEDALQKENHQGRSIAMSSLSTILDFSLPTRFTCSHNWPFHVPPLGSPQSHNSLFGQHVQWVGVNALRETRCVCVTHVYCQYSRDIALTRINQIRIWNRSKVMVIFLYLYYCTCLATRIFHGKHKCNTINTSEDMAPVKVFHMFKVKGRGHGHGTQGKDLL